MDNSEIVKNIWFASEKRALSASKFLVYDDQGSLEVDGDKLIFLSSKERLIFDQIQDISLSRQRWNWITWILGLLIILPIYFVCYLFFSALLNWGDIFIYLCLACVVVGIFMGFKTKWIILGVAGRVAGRSLIY